MSFLLSELTITLPSATLTSCSGSSSTHTTFGVSGSGLTASVTISAPSGFEISTDPGGTYSPSLTLTNTRTVSKTLYVRLKETAPAGSISGSITATSSSTTATTTVSGTVNAIPSISISETDASDVPDDAIICAGSSVTLTASGTTADYLWSTSTSSATITPSPLTTTTYTVTGTTSGCSNTASITITVNAIPFVNITVIDASGITNNDGIICNGASATLTVSGTTANYLWSTGESSTLITKSPTITTTYTVTATNSCFSNTASVTVSVNDLPTVVITETDVSGSVNNDSRICKGGSTTLTATGGSTYLWSTSSTSPTLNLFPSSNTTYTVTGTSAAGCSNITSVNITVETLPTISVSSISLCAESTYLIAKTTSISNNESWSVSGTITVNNGYVTAGTTQGTYTVSYTDGCAQTVSASVTVGNSDNGVSGVSGGQASYKISNSSPIPQGPTANVYVGYNGFNYYSTTKPTNTGYYKANNQSGNNAGCPYPFYIFRCTTCPD